MKPEVWKKHILDVVSRIADQKYQEKTWFGKSEKISSPEELYCELFDDYMYEDFLNSPIVNLNSSQKKLGRELKIKLDQFSIKYGDFTDPKKVFKDPLWDKIRKSAKSFLESF
jgi:hypothetical protein